MHYFCEESLNSSQGNNFVVLSKAQNLQTFMLAHVYTHRDTYTHIYLVAK